MRTIPIAAGAVALGFGLGWFAKPPRVVERVRTVDRRTAPPIVAQASPKLLDYPKPEIDPPQPIKSPVSLPGSSSAPLVGDLPRLPTALPGVVSDPSLPLAPQIPVQGLPAADLNADEARARRVVLRSGGEVVSRSDAKDASGKIGVTLVAEVSPRNRERLRGALRQELGDRVVLSDGGSVGGSTPEIRKAEDALATLKKKRDQARIDFLPNAPTLVDLEMQYREQERSLAELRQASGRERLNVLIRPTLGT